MEHGGRRGRAAYAPGELRQDHQVETPPANGTGPLGHDIQCRCAAYPMLLKADRERLKAAAAAT